MPNEQFNGIGYIAVMEHNDSPGREITFALKPGDTVNLLVSDDKRVSISKSLNGVVTVTNQRRKSIWVEDKEV